MGMPQLVVFICIDGAYFLCLGKVANRVLVPQNNV